MNLYTRIFKNSSIYVTANMVQKVLGFLLIPLYTRLLTPDQYGRMTVVTAVAVFLQMVFISSLSGAVTRFYFEYRNNPKQLREFLGTVFLSLFGFSAAGALLLIIGGTTLFAPVLGTVPFHPLMVLGLISVVFFPVFHTFLSFLQTVENARAYGILSVSSFILKAALAALFLTGTSWGAAGPLTAGVVVYVLYFVISCVMLHDRMALTVKWHYLREALAYSLPLLPHHVINHFKSITDKVFINRMISTASTGLYNIGFHFGSIISIISIAVNRAVIPSFMHGMKTDDDDLLERIRQLSLLVVFGYCLLSSVLSLFSREAVILLTTSSFYDGFIVVPFIAFNFAARGIYFLLVNTLFFYKKRTKLVVVGTAVGAILNIILNYWFILLWGILGAALATMVSQIVTLVVTGVIAHRYSRIRWNYIRFGLVFMLNFVATTFVTVIIDTPSLSAMAMKFALITALFLISSIIMWHSPFFLLAHGRELITALYQRNRHE